MGRPLHKKYFGNRNTGSASTTADDKIGGEGVASVVLNALGSYTTRPTVTFPAPSLPTGVTALGTVTSEVLSVTTVGGTQTGYTVGQLVTVNGSDAVLRVATIGGTGGDDALTFDFTGGSRGNFTTLPSGAQATTSNGAGAGLTVVLAFRAKAVVITEKGSGYTSAPAGGSLTFSQSVTATSTALTTDSGLVGSATNQENAIIIRAKIDAEATVRIGDIIKQSSARRYKVKTSDGTAVCKLVADDTPATLEAYIKATDANGNTYYVTKLTTHKALLTQWTQNGEATWLFESGTTAPWTFTTTANGRVIIENA
jgi:hypothetical protein